MAESVLRSSVPLRRGTMKHTPVKLRKPQFRGLVDKPVQWDTAGVSVQTMLDRVDRRLSGSLDQVGPAMEDLLTVLWSVKSTSDEDVWARTVERCLNHPVRDLIHQDPFAHRCFVKPRGYAGDATLIDYLYTRDCHSTATTPVSALGSRIFEFTRDIPAGHAVRRRRDLMASIIDQICQTHKNPRILSVACGHLREATLCKSVAAGRTGRFVALDQDEQSISVVDREVSGFGVTTVHNSIKALFRGPVSEERFDLIYSTGLYDYLDDRMGTKLTQRMFEMLNPGGRLIVANFVPGLVCSAYMEAFLDWKLIYRDTEQMRDLSATIPQSETTSRRVFLEDNDNIVFLDITRQ